MNLPQILHLISWNLKKRIERKNLGGGGLPGLDCLRISKRELKVRWSSA